MTMFIHPDDPSYAELEAELCEAQEAVTRWRTQASDENAARLKLGIELSAAKREVERLRAELAALRQKHTNILATDELIVAGLRGDIERLRASVTLHQQSQCAYAAQVGELDAQLTELREAAEALRADWSLNDSDGATVVRFLAVLAKAKP